MHLSTWSRKRASLKIDISADERKRLALGNLEGFALNVDRRWIGVHKTKRLGWGGGQDAVIRCRGIKPALVTQLEIVCCTDMARTLDSQGCLRSDNYSPRID